MADRNGKAIIPFADQFHAALQQPNVPARHWAGGGLKAPASIINFPDEA